jgi:hypothetical protein
MFLCLNLTQDDFMAVDGLTTLRNRLRASCARPLCSSNHVPSRGKVEDRVSLSDVGYMLMLQCESRQLTLYKTLRDRQRAVVGIYRQSNTLEGLIDDRNVTKFYGVLGTFTSR